MLEKIIISFVHNGLKADTYDSTHRYYEYCLFLILGHTLFITAVVIIGLLSGRLFPALVFLFSALPLRIFCGGAHAPTKQLCNVLSYGAAVIGIFPVPDLHVPIIFTLTLFVINWCSLLWISPVPPVNKSFDQTRIKKLRRRSVPALLIIFLEFSVFLILQLNGYCSCVCYCAIICNVSCMIGLIQNKRRQNEKQLPDSDMR